ncbi:formate/nitrite transporter family protein [Bacillus atrophaeus]|uniref:formate/nitrite transporter family protein n=1 Tax=Bacillus atrophaeus TaxID=1452 RepID=UPI0022823F66|nr:formate/nitrite transporter family protein [Bacillus atrophaeus]MCY8517968.1 formate/nitrite transporter family protein [Bacillus atrophaeus]
MAFRRPDEIAEAAIEAGAKKVNLPMPSLLVLGFLGGAFIALGYLLDIRVIGDLPKEWGSLSSFLGAAVFPVGLILVVLAGAELITGNMMSVAMALFSKKISVSQLTINWIIVTLMNLVGALFVAYVFGHLIGLTETGPYAVKTIAAAQGKLDLSFGQVLISGIGCNWLVCLAVWLSFGADDAVGKIAGIWFPIMAFVAIGFQHVVANMFIIPAAIFAGSFTWTQFIGNLIPAFIGNVIGGALFVGLIYFIAYQKKDRSTKEMKKVS